MNKGFSNRYRIIYANVKNNVGSHIDLDNCRGLDFGCGDGTSLLRFAIEHKDSKFYGVDIEDTFLRLPQNAKIELELDNVPENLFLSQIQPGANLDFDDNSFDFIYSWSVFEHVNRELIQDVLTDLRRVLKKGGLFFVQIDPLYFSARGAHLYDVLPSPWVHLLEQHDNLREKLFRPGEVEKPTSSRERLWQQYETLNRITVDELEAYFLGAGFTLVQPIKTSSDPREIPEALLKIYQEEVLRTHQVIAVFTAD